MLEGLEQLDKAITLAINSLHCEAGDYLWEIFSSNSVWFPMYIFIAYMLLRRLGTKKGLVVILSLALGVVICDQFANLIKDSVERLRPCYDSYMTANGLHIVEKRGGYFGFFSGHAANASCFAICSIIGFKNDLRRGYKAYSLFISIWAALVSVSRIFVGKHYFGDVVVGIAVGLLAGWLLGIAARAVIEKYFL